MATAPERRQRASEACAVPDHGREHAAEGVAARRRRVARVCIGWCGVRVSDDAALPSEVVLATRGDDESANRPANQRDDGCVCVGAPDTTCPTAMQTIGGGAYLIAGEGDVASLTLPRSSALLVLQLWHYNVERDDFVPRVCQKHAPRPRTATSKRRARRERLLGVPVHCRCVAEERKALARHPSASPSAFEFILIITIVLDFSYWSFVQPAPQLAGL